MAVNQNLGGTAGLTKLGAGTLVLTGNNNYPGATTVGAARLCFAATARPARSSTAMAQWSTADNSFSITPPTVEPTRRARCRATLPRGTGRQRSSQAALRTTNTASAAKGLGWLDNGSAVVVKYTYYGDANLDGKVNAQDFDALAAHYGATGTGVWAQGDFNYDGVVNTVDFNMLSMNYNATALSGAGLPAPSLGTLVPEPTSMVLALGGLALLGRRKRDGR